MMQELKLQEIPNIIVTEVDDMRWHFAVMGWKNADRLERVVDGRAPIRNEHVDDFVREALRGTASVRVRPTLEAGDECQVTRLRYLPGLALVELAGQRIPGWFNVPVALDDAPKLRDFVDQKVNIFLEPVFGG